MELRLSINRGLSINRLSRLHVHGWSVHRLLTVLLLVILRIVLLPGLLLWVLLIIRLLVGLRLGSQILVIGVCALIEVSEKRQGSGKVHKKISYPEDTDRAVI